jgi:hypothetical protein
MNEWGAVENESDVVLMFGRTLNAAYEAYKAVAYSPVNAYAGSWTDSYKAADTMLTESIKGYCKVAGIKTRVSRIREIMLDSGENAYYAIDHLASKGW